MKRRDEYSEPDVLDVDLYIDQTTPILEDDEAEEDTRQSVATARRQTLSREMKSKTDILEDLHLVAGKGPQVMPSKWIASHRVYWALGLVKIVASLCVSSGCVSYGLCVAFTSSALPSLLHNNSTFTITHHQATWTG